jgi:agmatine deiminase
MCDESDTEHYRELKLMEQELLRFRDLHGKPYRLRALPLPAPIFAEDGHRLPATYANFLIINNAVLVPVYDDQNDALALQILASIFSNRDIIPINCLPVIRQHGSLHCLAMQLPQGVLSL